MFIICIVFDIAILLKTAVMFDISYLNRLLISPEAETEQPTGAD